MAYLDTDNKHACMYLTLAHQCRTEAFKTVNLASLMMACVLLPVHICIHRTCIGSALVLVKAAHSTTRN